jgi:hypothetical protein
VSSFLCRNLRQSEEQIFWLVTCVMFSRWSAVGVDSFLDWLHRVTVGSVPGLSEVYSASLTCVVLEFLCMFRMYPWVGEVGVGGPTGQWIGVVVQRKNWQLVLPGCHLSKF